MQDDKKDLLKLRVYSGQEFIIAFDTIEEVMDWTDLQPSGRKFRVYAFLGEITDRVEESTHLH